ncbi:MAG: hypothetical protein LQ344_005719 [Seirophora lacunosa]|nr:MAG: hypothetical protein LQ344_005719 [Seirophora lacunosa]
MEDVGYPDVVYGSLLSLYHTLDRSTISLLETAILQRNLRNFSESLVIFDSMRTTRTFRPAIVLEHTWTLVAQYCFKEARSVGTKGLSSLVDAGGGYMHFGPAVVLRALLAGLDTLIDGTVHGCYQSLSEIYQWLSPVPVEDFTDTQVWAVNLYYYLPTLLENPGGLPNFYDIPHTPTGSQLYGITLLRQHLQRSGRLNEAHFLLDTETALLPSKDAEIAAMESVRSACLEPSTQPLTYIQGTVALKLALMYAQLGDNEGYREEMFNAAGALASLRDTTGGMRSNLLRTDTWLARLELGRAQGQEPEAETWEAFADYAAKVGDFRVEVKALTDALECMISPEAREAEEVLPAVKKRLRVRLDGLYARLGSSFHRSGQRGCEGSQDPSGGGGTGLLQAWG